jgi:hypothetical protein
MSKYSFSSSNLIFILNQSISREPTANAAFKSDPNKIQDFLDKLKSITPSNVNETLSLKNIPPPPLPTAPQQTLAKAKTLEEIENEMLNSSNANNKSVVNRKKIK